MFLNHLVRHRPWSEIFGRRSRFGVVLLGFAASLRELTGRRVA